MFGAVFPAKEHIDRFLSPEDQKPDGSGTTLATLSCRTGMHAEKRHGLIQDQTMATYNKDIAEIFEELADLLDIMGENQYRIRSYRKAAQTLKSNSENVAGKEENGEDLTSLPGIGESLSDKIEEIVKTGELKQLKKLKKKIPGSLIEIMNLEQMGPRRTRKLYEELGIESVKELKEAAEEGKVEEVEGFGKKTSRKLVREIEEFEASSRSARVKRNEAEEMVEPLLGYLEKDLDHMTVAGSYRRKKETVGDIDILATSQHPGKSMDHFVNYDETEEVLAKGETKSSVRLRRGLQVDLRLVKKSQYGAALVYFTGSKDHNISIRKRGQKKGYKVNEYGIFQGEKKIAGKTEDEVYEALGYAFVEPELREGRGELEASENGNLPELVILEDIRGDLQTHTKASDGKYSLGDMVDAARELGYDYYAVTDHSKRVTVANGLDEKRLEKQIEEIDALNEKFKNFRILKSVEVDILEDGSLDLPEEILRKLDLTICSIHYRFNLSGKKQTERVIRAMDHPSFNIFAHPTGRMINQRKPYDIDMEAVMKAALDRGCYLEVNANPDRLDLNDHHIKTARDMGLKLSISTDAHTVDGLRNMKYGVAQARRGWMEKKDVLNTRSWKQLKQLLKR